MNIGWWYRLGLIVFAWANFGVCLAQVEKSADLKKIAPAAVVDSSGVMLEIPGEAAGAKAP